MDKRERKRVEEQIRAKESALHEFRRDNPQKVDRITAQQNEIDGLRKYLKGF